MSQRRHSSLGRRTWLGPRREMADLPLIDIIDPTLCWKRIQIASDGHLDCEE